MLYSAQAGRCWGSQAPGRAHPAHGEGEMPMLTITVRGSLSSAPNTFLWQTSGNLDFNRAALSRPLVQSGAGVVPCLIHMVFPD